MTRSDERNDTARLLIANVREGHAAKVRLRGSRKFVAGHQHRVLDEVQNHLPHGREPAHVVPVAQVRLDRLEELLLRNMEMNALTMEPPDVPDTTWGNSPSSSRTMTPK